MDVICLGILVADVIVKSVRELPETGKLATVDSIDLSLGGCAANTAVGLSRLGHETCVMGAIGDDGFGEFICDALAEEGIDDSGVIRLEGKATSATAVLVNPEGERSFLHFKGANALFAGDDLDLRMIELATHLHIGGTFLMDTFDNGGAVTALKLAKEAGLSTSLDTAWDASGRWIDVLEPMFEYVDIFLPSDEEARMITSEDDPREMARFIMSRGVKTVGIKRGRKGGYFRSATGEYSIPALHVKVVDTTGCGDAFCAGFISGALDGLSLKGCALRAVMVGSACATRIGATAALPDRETLDKLMSEHIDETKFT